MVGEWEQWAMLKPLMELILWGRGITWPLALNGLLLFSLNLYLAPPFDSHRNSHPLPPGQRYRKHQGNTNPAGFWISSHWNPQPEPATPDLFFTPFPQQSHAIHVCLHVEQRQGCMWMCMFKRVEGLWSCSPGTTYILSRNFVGNSGLILPCQAKLSWYAEVLCCLL